MLAGRSWIPPFLSIGVRTECKYSRGDIAYSGVMCSRPAVSVTDVRCTRAERERGGRKSLCGGSVATHHLDFIWCFPILLLFFHTQLLFQKMETLSPITYPPANLPLSTYSILICSTTHGLGHRLETTRPISVRAPPSPFSSPSSPSSRPHQVCRICPLGC